MSDKDEIELLDSKIARLKVDYEQYFAKIQKREPAKLRDEVDRTVLSLSNRQLTNTGLKFKLNSIVAKYNSYKQYWTRILRAIEEGTYVRKGEGAMEFESALGRPGPETVERAPAQRQTPQGGNGFDDLYSKYIEARRSCNEPVEGITPEVLKKTVEQYRKKVEEQYHTKDVEFKVSVKDGKAKLTIIPKKGG